MTRSDWLDLTVLERKKYNLLSEVMDLSQQLGEALDRSDDVSVRLLVSMRQDPILRLEEIKAAIGSKRDSMPPEEWERVNDLNGGAQPRDEDETVYLNQVGSVRRILERVLELDQRLNRRMAGDDSFYAQKKP
ncbi:hypothetical protein N510_002919 [Firmicutes bacterium ASF500]|mgnify:FL=1|nr:hypothetical protein N510_002919 [Firmicutes bacterium ASF500]